MPETSTLCFHYLLSLSLPSQPDCVKSVGKHLLTINNRDCLQLIKYKTNHLPIVNMVVN